jgi:GTP cyclohydrolase I
MATKEEIDNLLNQEIVKKMLVIIGEDIKRPGLKDTPKRVVKMWKEIFRCYDKTQLPKITVFDNGSDGIVYDQMIMDTGDFYSHCEHHIVPFFGKYYFAYIPHPKGKILGLSKVARVVDYFSAKLQVQERLVQEIVNYLWNELSVKNSNGDMWLPIAMALVLDGEHLCKTMRGVKKKGKMRTTEVRGAIKIDSATRAEFLSWVNSNGK